MTTLLSSSSVASLRARSVNIALGAAFIPGLQTEMGNVPTGFSATNFTIASQQSNFESMSAQVESRIETVREATGGAKGTNRSRPHAS